MQDHDPQGVSGMWEDEDTHHTRTHRCHSMGIDAAEGPPQRAETENISYAQTLLNDLANSSFPSLFMPEHILFANGKVSS